MLAILAAALLAATPGSDTVYTANGGRLVGTVVEETPQVVTIQLPDGTTRRLSRSDVSRIVYADGSVSTPNRPPPPPPPTYRAPAQAYPAQPPPPAYRPPPPPAYGPPGYGPPAYPPAQQHRGTPALMPFWLSFGLGGSFPSGDAAATERGPIPMDAYFGNQLGIWLEGGARVTPHLGLGLYLDLGVGDVSSSFRSTVCDPVGSSCTASTGRFGVLLRHTFEPYGTSTPWIAAGTGYEWANATLDATNEQLFSYSGWEMLRLMGGLDLRTSPVFGVGLYAGVSFGRYTHYEDALGPVSSFDQRTHTTVEAGVRFTLFP